MVFSGAMMEAGGSVLLKHDWPNDNFFLVLCSSAHAHSISHTTYGQLTNVIASQAIASKTVSNSGANNYADCADITVAAGPHSAKHGYIVHAVGGSLTGTDELLAYIDFNVGVNANIQIPEPLVINSLGLLNAS